MASPEPVLIGNLTWPQAARLTEDGERLCLLPVGALEQHGRHLPVRTDTAIAEAISEAASRRTGVPVLPCLWATSSQAHTKKWPGTYALTPRLLIDVVVQLADWVRSSGFTKLLLLNAHGGNIGPLRVAVDEIRCRGDLQIGAINWFTLTAEIEAFVNSDGSDVHANRAETSLMLHLHPDLVDRSAIADDPDRTLDSVFNYTVAQTSIDGLTGSPSLATAEDGAWLFGLVVDALSEKIERARAETPPELASPGSHR
ncbi:MAG TPA: creatininase family protein [Candidatus Dormibacteraeota bacterium]|nr:creatininase family protein [Candidatus Dormibacteraeota bacterium]